MNITLGVYDLFAYAVPGSLYLALVTYVAERLAWINLLGILQVNTAIVIISAGILSYLVGHITYRLGYLLSRAYGRDKNMDDARREFVERVPSADGRPFLQMDRSIMQAAAELHESGAAVEIGRLRAIGLMLRNSAPVFILAAVVELGDLASGSHPIAAVCCIVIFPLAAVGCLSQSAVIRHWANMKTFELAYCVPGIDDLQKPYNPSARPSVNRRSLPASQKARNSAALTARQSKRARGQ
jgi:hypothetical protein